MMNQLINAVQMTGRYGKEVYLEVDIMAIVDVIGTIIQKHKLKFIYVQRAKNTRNTELSIKRTTVFNCHKNKITYTEAHKDGLTAY